MTGIPPLSPRPLTVAAAAVAAAPPPSRPYLCAPRRRPQRAPDGQVLDGGEGGCEGGSGQRGCRSSRRGGQHPRGQGVEQEHSHMPVDEAGQGGDAAEHPRGWAAQQHPRHPGGRSEDGGDGGRHGGDRRLSRPRNGRAVEADDGGGQGGQPRHRRCIYACRRRPGGAGGGETTAPPLRPPQTPTPAFGGRTRGSVGRWRVRLRVAVTAPTAARVTVSRGGSSAPSAAHRQKRLFFDRAPCRDG